MVFGENSFDDLGVYRMQMNETATCFSEPCRSYGIVQLQPVEGIKKPRPVVLLG